MLDRGHVHSCPTRRSSELAVSDYVLGDANAGEFVERYLEMIAPVLRGYSAENKHFTTLAIGCTGGKHRSVAVAEKIGDELRRTRSEEHTSELQSRFDLVCR